MQVFGLWEESGVPGENPRRHGENMQTPHRRGRDVNPGPQNCEGDVLVHRAAFSSSIQSNSHILYAGYEEKEIEANDLMQQLQRCAVEKEQMMDEMKALQWKLDEETRRTANLEKQSAGIGSSRPTTRVGISGMENGWMDGYSPFNDPGQQCSDKSTQRTEGRKEFRKGGIVGTKETREKSLFQRKKDERKSSLFQSFMIKRNNASQDKIADLEGQVHSSSQDLEDEMENCSYLKRQLVRVVNMLRRSDDQLAFYEKRKQREEDYRKEEEEPIYVEMKPCWTSSPNDSSLDRSSLDCPRCQIRCPISQYRQMMDHLEVCLN
ncbi:centrosomal protein of 55 kDa-like isoform X6 [Phyllopteryx taeniolatus]|uniref:centrosomal protein of 55 kDa-like isoform X6 n=1 Tax=Phyllopteryx taeniolatus TaxID=161469 RepID=UPI002AD41938|nr:centrosomal protein of 55 kDa-like isoform X6 [Phyllopteryx taeniolatus]